MIVALISWWYGAGWSQAARHAAGRIQGALDFFSVSLLVKTLFDPFRQIGTDDGGQSLDAQVRAWGDRTFSRVVGFVVRTMVICFGVVVAGSVAILSLLQLLVWPFVPLLPMIGVALMLLGIGA